MINSEDVKYLETHREAAHGTQGFWEFRVACYWQAPSLRDIKNVAMSLVLGDASCVMHAVSMYTGSDCCCVPCSKLPVAQVV